MGCNIYFHIELKISGKWEHYACPEINRWYDLFALLADVRNDSKIEPISAPKGLPSDLSIITQIAYKNMENVAHTTSWLNVDEILRLSETLCEWEKRDEIHYLRYNLEYDILNTYLFGKSFADHKKYSDMHLPNGVEDVRFVFWFDH